MWAGHRHGHRRPGRRAQRLRERLFSAPKTSRIDGPKKVTKGTKAFFTFAASVASATFECQVDTGAYKPCASPFKVKTKKLKKGKHTLTVRAVQPAGNADPTPSTFKFKVKARRGITRSGTRLRRATADRPAYLA